MAELKTINDKLVDIQQQLKVPKGLYNSFSGFHYRSAEAILEAVKPLIHAHNLTLVLSDRVVHIGDSNYVKAFASLRDGTSDISVSAYAREEVVKKGMDSAQITGSTSSYARKYALNGLFAIDDTADPDSKNNNEPVEPVKPATRTPQVKPASAIQKVELLNLMKAKSMDGNTMTLFVESVINKARVETEVEFERVKKALEE